MKAVLIQGSLRKESNTYIVIKQVEKTLKANKVKTEVIDLRKIKLQFCDGRELKNYNKDHQKAFKAIQSADILIFGMPVYCYSVSGVLKNFIDITAKAMERKTAAILCNAGSKMSYLASADLMKILSFESQVTTVQPIVKTSKEDFDNNKITNPKILEKIDQLTKNLLN